MLLTLSGRRLLHLMVLIIRSEFLVRLHCLFNLLQVVPVYADRLESGLLTSVRGLETHRDKFNVAHIGTSIHFKHGKVVGNDRLDGRLDHHLLLLYLFRIVLGVEFLHILDLNQVFIGRRAKNIIVLPTLSLFSLKLTAVTREVRITFGLDVFREYGHLICALLHLLFYLVLHEYSFPRFFNFYYVLSRLLHLAWLLAQARHRALVAHAVLQFQILSITIDTTPR